MNWTVVEKKRTHRESMPDNLVRLTRKSVAISPNIAERFQAGREIQTSPSGIEREVLNLGLAIDEQEQAIKLLPNVVGGFRFATGANTKSGTLIATKPVGIIRSGLAQIGDYELVDDKELAFRLAR